LFSQPAFSQTDEGISETEVQRILGFLSSDSLKGRGNYSPELYTAAEFIADEFGKDSLSALFDSSYFQPFTSKFLSRKLRDSVAAGTYDPKKILLNVVGVLEGKSRPNEIVVFSAHYDHIGGSAGKKRDAIFNGANDNASGTTAVLSLAHYFAKRKDNERTIIFCAFAGEELGLLGSNAFVHRINPESFVAVINIEMVGSTNAAGLNAFLLTGAEQSDLKHILQKNLEGSSITVLDDRNPERQLFQRSDNYPFALKGIAAHTIMSSDDGDDCYHRTCDEMARIDTKNMTKLIRSIAVATASIISGEDTPTRINISQQPMP
jgi:Zn-dependent M28 family amino/carboxypeptidase